MSKRTLAKHKIALSTPGEIWWAACIHESQSFRLQLQSLLKNTPQQDLPERLQQLHNVREREEMSARDTFFEISGLQGEGLKQAVQFGFEPPLQNVFVLLEAQQSPAGESFDSAADGTPIALFNEIDVSKLPEDAFIVRVTDPRHAALATWCEMLDYLDNQVEAIHHVKQSPELAWQDLNALRFTLQGASKLGEEGLKQDDFIGWRRVIPQIIDLGSGMQKINELAASAKCQRVLACHFAATWLHYICDRMEYEGEAETRLQKIHQKILDVAIGLKNTLNSLNQDLVAKQPTLMENRYATTLYCRALQYDTPVVIAKPTKNTPRSRSALTSAKSA